MPHSDLIPEIHARRLGATRTPTVSILGDSTATERANSVDQTETIWHALQMNLQRQNPSKVFRFLNRAIGKARWSHVCRPGAAIGLQLPSWFEDTSRTWLDIVASDAPDVLIVSLGTNAPSAGQTAGPSVATFMKRFLDGVAAWPKMPDIWLATPKVANPEAGDQFSKDQESYKAVAAFIRTLARTNANIYNIKEIPPLGLIDLGRRYVMGVAGFDPANQYLRRVPIGNLDRLATFPTRLPETTDGDYKLTVRIISQGPVVSDRATTSIDISSSLFFGNKWRFTHHEGLIRTGYYIDDEIGLSGVSVPSEANEIKISIVAKGEFISAALNGIETLSARAPRLISGFAPTVSVSGPRAAKMDVLEFLEGVGTPTERIMSPKVAFGSPLGDTGGNAINHLSSAGVAAFDYSEIESLNMRA
jgi:hypothetical protein